MIGTHVACAVIALVLSSSSILNAFEITNSQHCFCFGPTCVHLFRIRSQAEKEAQQTKLEESMRGSAMVQARKAAEDLERRRMLQAKRTERMEFVREKRRLAVNTRRRRLKTHERDTSSCFFFFSF